jgi:hypothetical protein
MFNAGLIAIYILYRRTAHVTCVWSLTVLIFRLVVANHVEHLQTVHSRSNFAVDMPCTVVHVLTLRRVLHVWICFTCCVLLRPHFGHLDCLKM